MFNLSKKTSRFSRYYKKIKLNIIRVFSNLVGFHNYIIPYSNMTSDVLVTFSKNNSRLNKSETIQSTFFFQYKIYYQNSDFRAYFNTNWDEEATRIIALYKAANLFTYKDFYDIGANYGLYSLPFLNDKNIKTKIALEPSPFLVPCLEKTLGKDFEIIQCAVTPPQKEEKNFDKYSSFNLMPMVSGGSSLSKKINKPFLSFEIKVRNYPIDMLLKNYKKSNAVIIKIDIEDAEIDLLRAGMIEEIKKNYLEFIILIEYIPKSKKINKEFFSYFRNLYSIALSDLNWKGSKRFDYKLDLKNKKLDLKKFYDLEINKGGEKYLNSDIKYSDIMFFSSQKLAEKFMVN